MKVAALMRYRIFGNWSYFGDGEAMLEALYEERYDVAVIDFVFFEEIRCIRDYFTGPILFIDEYIDELHLKRALEVGDYYFLYHEESRIRCQLRHLERKLHGNRIYRSGNLYFDRLHGRLFIGSKEHPLTKTESELLQRLTQKELVTYDELLDGVVSSKESLKVLIFRLRKLGFEIRSIKNVGYKLLKKE